MNGNRSLKVLSTSITYMLSVAFIISCSSPSQTVSKASIVGVGGMQESTGFSLEFIKGIVSIFEDSKGNYWFGSAEEGVCIYDGETYDYFTINEGLPGNQVHSIQEDSQGKVWISTGKGLCYFDGMPLVPTTVTKEEGATTSVLSKEMNWSMESEDLWFADYSNGLLRYRNETLENLAIPVAKDDRLYAREQIDRPFHNQYAVIKVYQDRFDKLWIGTFSRGVVSYDGDAFEYHNPDKFGVGTIRSVFQDSDGLNWFGSNGGGLYTYDGVNYTNFTKEKGLLSNVSGYSQVGTLSRVWGIEQDNKGKMWFGTADSGLWVYDGATMINYTTADGLPSNFVESIYKDRKGRLWFCSGSNPRGVLFTLNGTSFDLINSVENEE